MLAKMKAVERKCKNIGCEDILMAKDLLEHETKTCHYRPVSCPIENCKEKIPARGMFGHIELKHK